MGGLLFWRDRLHNAGCSGVAKEMLDTRKAYVYKHIVWLSDFLPIVYQ